MAKRKKSLPTVAQRLKQLEATVDMLMALEMGRIMAPQGRTNPEFVWTWDNKLLKVEHKPKAKKRRKTK